MTPKYKVQAMRCNGESLTLNKNPPGYGPCSVTASTPHLHCGGGVRIPLVSTRCKSISLPAPEDAYLHQYKEGAEVTASESGANFGLVAQFGRASVLQAEGHGFKSHRCRSSVGRASDLQSESHGFESHRGPQIIMGL